MQRIRKNMNEDFSVGTQSTRRAGRGICSASENGIPESVGNCSSPQCCAKSTFGKIGRLFSDFELFNQADQFLRLNR
jgi:hypothetical protein